MYDTKIIVIQIINNFEISFLKSINTNSLFVY